VTPSILDRLDQKVSDHPEKLLFSFLDLNGQTLESYTYESFQQRVAVIAGHLRVTHNFKPNDRILLAYPAGLEMICAFFGCVRAGLIPVPVYPPTSSSFQSALEKMAHIARDCGAAGVLTGREYRDSLNNNLARFAAASDDAAFMSSLPWVTTQDLVESATDQTFSPTEDIVFLQYTSGSTSNPKGVMVSHANILANSELVVLHPAPIAVTWLPQYHDMGLIGYYIYSALRSGTTYGFSPFDFIQRPSLWLESISKYHAVTSAAPNFAFDYCLRPGRISEETLESLDLSSLQHFMTAAEPVRPATYNRFLQTFQRYGLKPEAFWVAYGLAENTLAVSDHGRTILSVNKNALSLRRIRPTTSASEVSSAKQLVSCGKPLPTVGVKIVDPEHHLVLENGNVGEIWVSGPSKCLGYWNNPALTDQMFNAHPIGESQNSTSYLRTGDLGFIHDEELYVCGRVKDMIIVRGQNYYPQDIEHVVEDSTDLIRKTCVAAFEINEDDEPALAVIVEAKSLKSYPDPRDLVSAIRNHLNIDAALVAVIAPKSLPKTSSGKIMRRRARQLWLEGSFKVLAQVSREMTSGTEPTGESATQFDLLKTRYHLTGTENFSLIEAGVDSVDLVIFMHEIKESLKERGAGSLAEQVDIRLIQQITVAEIFQLNELFERSPEEAVLHVRHSLGDLLEATRKKEERMMTADRQVAFTPPALLPPAAGPSGGIFLTGGTGFLGPFLLKSLLEQTTDKIYVLVRAKDEASAAERLVTNMNDIGPIAEPFQRMFPDRVVPVCGDLSKPSLGLSDAQWDFLAENIHTIYHNGAIVNYLFNYEKMRSANVLGTNEVLRLAFDKQMKVFNLVSSTFIFGWATKEVLYETDCNQKMELLDFGYSQTKWVAEQVVMDAAKHGLNMRMFRPALISPSVMGGGNNLDIAIRLLAFMVNNGIGVEALNQVSFTPADVVANNIIAISNMPETINATYHVTRDHYANMVDITDIITQLTGRPFEMFKLKEFVPAVIKRCTREDPLFPLLDFLIGSIDSISSMEFKRYDSSGYMRARDASPFGVQDPSLEDTVTGILRFLQRQRLIAPWMNEANVRQTARPVAQ
jgi:thioester reductase-like protein